MIAHCSLLRRCHRASFTCPTSISARGNGLDDPDARAGDRRAGRAGEPDARDRERRPDPHGGASEHEAAAEYLRALGRPLLVIPGNHDIPPLPPGRFTRPWREFERVGHDRAGRIRRQAGRRRALNSVRPLGYQRGHVQRRELERAEAQLAQAQPGALRVVALHHQLTGAPWRTRKLPLSRRGRTYSHRLADCGAELIVGGHIHQAAVSERHEFEVWPVTARLPWSRPRRASAVRARTGVSRARGVLVYAPTSARIRVETTSGATRAGG